MNRTTSKLGVAARLDRQAGAQRTGAVRADGISYLYRRHIAASRELFAAPPVDLGTLVIAQEIKRKAQAELQREVLRDTAYQYEMPISHERNGERNDGRNDGRGARINPADFDE